MYEVVLQTQSQKYFKKLNPKTAKQLAECFKDLEKDPFCRRTKALSGVHKGRRRCRVGAIRVIYEVDVDTKIVNVIAILPRGDVYKKGFII